MASSGFARMPKSLVKLLFKLGIGSTVLKTIVEKKKRKKLAKYLHQLKRRYTVNHLSALTDLLAYSTRADRLSNPSVSIRTNPAMA